MVRSRRPALALALAVGLALAGCGSTTQTTAPSPGPGLAVEDLRYTCGEFPFGLEILDKQGNAERGNDEASAVLRQAIAFSPVMMPETGWIQVGRNQDRVEFVNAPAIGEFFFVQLMSAEGGWRFDAIGSCAPKAILAEGIGAAEWQLDPAGPAPGPESTSIAALVTERACNSGRPADGRIVGPQLIVDANRVIVVFGVRPREGAQECPSNPATPVVFELPMQLGDRELLDGGTLPFADPAEPRL